jgi:hypothetical protein
MPPKKVRYRRLTPKNYLKLYNLSVPPTGAWKQRESRYKMGVSVKLDGNPTES